MLNLFLAHSIAPLPGSTAPHSFSNPNDRHHHHLDRRADGLNYSTCCIQATFDMYHLVFSDFFVIRSEDTLLHVCPAVIDSGPRAIPGHPRSSLVFQSQLYHIVVDLELGIRIVAFWAGKTRITGTLAYGSLVRFEPPSHCILVWQFGKYEEHQFSFR